jgi:hypothetical protein
MYMSLTGQSQRDVLFALRVCWHLSQQIFSWDQNGVVGCWGQSFAHVHLVMCFVANENELARMDATSVEI